MCVWRISAYVSVRIIHYVESYTVHMNCLELEIRERVTLCTRKLYALCFMLYADTLYFIYKNKAQAAL